MITSGAAWSPFPCTVLKVRGRWACWQPSAAFITSRQKPRVHSCSIDQFHVLVFNLSHPFSICSTLLHAHSGLFPNSTPFFLSSIFSPKRHKQPRMSENFVAPGQQRYLRACMVCSIVMTFAVRTDFFVSPTPKSSTTNKIYSGLRKKDAPTAKNFFISKAPRTRSTAALHRSLRVSSHLPTRANHGSPNGSASTVM